MFFAYNGPFPIKGGFCPSCDAKRLEEWGEWMRQELILDVPHRYPGPPTRTAIGRIEDFKKFLEPLLAKMTEITTKDIPELNKFLAEKKLDYIKIP
jgi:hypothetical protein